MVEDLAKDLKVGTEPRRKHRIFPSRLGPIGEEIAIEVLRSQGFDVYFYLEWERFSKKGYEQPWPSWRTERHQRLTPRCLDRCRTLAQELRKIRVEIGKSNPNFIKYIADYEQTLKRLHPDWGSDRIQDVLERLKEDPLPCLPYGPDLVAIKGEDIHFIEVKVNEAPFTPLQKRFFQLVKERLGINVAVLRINIPELEYSIRVEDSSSI